MAIADRLSEKISFCSGEHAGAQPRRCSITPNEPVSALGGKQRTQGPLAGGHHARWRSPWNWPAAVRATASVLPCVADSAAGVGEPLLRVQSHQPAGDQSRPMPMRSWIPGAAELE